MSCLWNLYPQTIWSSILLLATFKHRKVFWLWCWQLHGALLPPQGCQTPPSWSRSRSRCWSEGSGLHCSKSTFLTTLRSEKIRVKCWGIQFLASCLLLDCKTLQKPKIHHRSLQSHINSLLTFQETHMATMAPRDLYHAFLLHPSPKQRSHLFLTWGLCTMHYVLKVK